MASIIIDLWMVANFIYYRANDLYHGSVVSARKVQLDL